MTARESRPRRLQHLVGAVYPIGRVLNDGPRPPRELTVTGGGPGLEAVGVITPGADGLQVVPPDSLVISSVHPPEYIISWSTVNCTERVSSMGLQHTADTKLHEPEVIDFGPVVDMDFAKSVGVVARADSDTGWPER